MVRIFIWYILGIVVRWTTPDPCKEFLTELEKRDVLDFGIGPQLPEIEAQRYPNGRRPDWSTWSKG